MTGSPAPLLLVFVDNLMFSVRIEAAARKLNYRCLIIERGTDYVPETAADTTGRTGERTGGPEAALIERLSSERPALIVFDLGQVTTPWRSWIAMIKSSPATRRIPIVCYGSHMDAGTMKAAADAGADAVLARSRMFDDLNGTLQKYARITDGDAIRSACEEPLSAQALHGLELFNRGEYFEAHEALEAAWNADPGPGRELYRSILQAAVAYLQIERHNYNGAVKMFLRLRQWIDPLPDSCRGVNVAGLRLDANRARDRLMELGPEKIAAFDRDLFRPVEYILKPRN
jgi:CheY-like chemotaxis protein